MENFNVTTDMVLTKTPIDTRNVTANSEWVNLAKIEGIIEDGASMLKGVLVQNQMLEQTLADPSSLKQIQDAVVFYAVSEILDILTFTDKAKTWRSKFETLYREYASKPSALGNSYPGDVDSVVETPKERPFNDFSGFNYRF